VVIGQRDAGNQKEGDNGGGGEFRCDLLLLSPAEYGAPFSFPRSAG
jgi:hypothetical protein